MEEPLPENYTWMCTECFHDCTEIGIIAPGYSLILKPDGKYYILGGQGHNGEELACFPHKPFPDPDPECEAETGPVAEASDRWLDEADDFDEATTKLEMNFSEAAAFFNSCWPEYEKSGHNRFEYWVFHRAGVLIEEHEGKRPKSPPPPDVLDGHWNYRVMKHVDPVPEKFRHIVGHNATVWYGIHEFYYGIADGGNAWSVDPMPVVGDNVEQLREMLAAMRVGTMAEILDYDAPNAGTAPPAT